MLPNPLLFFLLYVVWVFFEVLQGFPHTWVVISLSWLFSSSYMFLFFLHKNFNITDLLKYGLLLLFSCSVVSNSLWPHGLQHARLPGPSPTPGACSNSCPSRCWCHPTILSSVVPLSSCLQSFPASGSFQMSQFFASGGQSIGVSASASVLPMNIQDWFPLGWTGWISLQSGLSRVFSNTKIWKYYNTSVLQHSAFFMVHLSHLYMATGKTIAFSSGCTNLCQQSDSVIHINISIVFQILFSYYRILNKVPCAIQ